MAKVRNPTTLAGHYAIPPEALDRLGVLNPTLGIDTRLFIDPLLLASSAHGEISHVAVEQYRGYFTTIIKLLSASKRVDDVPWRNAQRMFQFHELKATCLGYGAGSIYGSGFGAELSSHVLRTAKEIVDLGVVDPDLFSAMALFEEGIGPDRISDMATNVILGTLLSFNERALKELGLNGEPFELLGHRATLLRNPLQAKRTPILLVPRDVLRELPTAMDWDGVCAAAAHNASLRERVNKHIAHMWEVKARRDKRLLRAQALASKQAFETILDAIRGVSPRAYDVKSDPLGLVRWAELAKQVTDQFPIELTVRQPLDLDAVHEIVRTIVAQFRRLVEDNGLSRSLWYRGEPLREKYAQRLFFAAAHCYCRANNLDISPEVDSGTGQVDFKFAGGFDSRVLVEVKLSSNKKLVQGYDKQLETYKRSAETMRAVYLVVDVGRMGKKAEQLIKLRNDAAQRGRLLSDLEFIDGRPKPSASRV